MIGSIFELEMTRSALLRNIGAATVVNNSHLVEDLEKKIKEQIREFLTLYYTNEHEKPSLSLEDLIKASTSISIHDIESTHDKEGPQLKLQYLFLVVREFKLFKALKADTYRRCYR